MCAGSDSAPRSETFQSLFLSRFAAMLVHGGRDEGERRLGRRDPCSSTFRSPTRSCFPRVLQRNMPSTM